MNRRKNMSNDWKEQKKRQKAIFTAQQNLPYEVKVRKAEHDPQKISPLDYTIIYVLKHCLEEQLKEVK